MLRCIRLICGKAALSHQCLQTSTVNHTPAEADSGKVVISLREVVGHCVLLDKLKDDQEHLSMCNKGDQDSNFDLALLQAR